jgi:hypothetical protein
MYLGIFSPLRSALVCRHRCWKLRWLSVEKTRFANISRLAGRSRPRFTRGRPRGCHGHVVDAEAPRLFQIELHPFVDLRLDAGLRLYRAHQPRADYVVRGKYICRPGSGSATEVSLRQRGRGEGPRHRALRRPAEKRGGDCRSHLSNARLAPTYLIPTLLALLSAERCSPSTSHPERARRAPRHSLRRMERRTHRA